MEEEFRIPLFTSTVLCEVTGYEPVTFRAHRNRLGLFGHTRMKAEDGGRGQRTVFTFLELCVARVVILLTKQGMPAENAVWFADTHAKHFLARVMKEGASPTTTRFEAIRLATRPGEVPEFISRGANDSIGSLFQSRTTPTTLIDLWEVVQSVQEAVNALPSEDNLHGKFAFLSNNGDLA